MDDNEPSENTQITLDANGDETIKKRGFQKGYDPRRADNSTEGKAKRRKADGKELVGMARILTDEALDTVARIMRNPKAKAVDRLKAADLILKRGWGNPSSSVKVEGAVQHAHAHSQTLDVGLLTSEAREAILAAQMQRLTPMITVEAKSVDRDD